MSSRGDDRPYKVVYSSRRRDDIDEQIPSRRPRRDYDYEDDYRKESKYSRDYRDDRDDRVEVDRMSRTSDSRTATGLTKTRYEVGRDRNSEAYVKRTDAVVVDQPGDHGRYEYEVLRPQRQDDGTYVVDIGGGRSQDYVIDLDSRGYDRAPRPRYEAPPPSRRDDALVYEPRGGGRDRGVRDVTYRDVQSNRRRRRRPLQPPRSCS